VAVDASSKRLKMNKMERVEELNTGRAALLRFSAILRGEPAAELGSLGE